MAIRLTDVWVKQLAEDIGKGTPNFGMANRIAGCTGPVDVTPLLKYMGHSKSIIKDIVIKIVAVHGDAEVIAKMLLQPMDYKKALELLRLIGKRDGWNVQIIIPLLKCPYLELRNEAINVIRERGEKDAVLAAIAIDNPQLHERLKDFFK